LLLSSHNLLAVIVVPLPGLNDDGDEEELEKQAEEKALQEAKMAESVAVKAAKRRVSDVHNMTHCRCWLLGSGDCW
jgi:tRNA(Ser,Leu) C12 N-acetylase TAN1